MSQKWPLRLDKTIHSVSQHESRDQWVCTALGFGLYGSILKLVGTNHQDERACDNRFCSYSNALRFPAFQDVLFLSSWTRTLTGSSLMTSPTGFEPAAYGLRGRNLRFPRFPHDIDMDSFKVFLDRNHSPKASKDILYYAKIYGSCLLEHDFSKLNNFSISKKRHTLVALSNLEVSRDT